MKPVAVYPGTEDLVALLVSAWIETYMVRSHTTIYLVALLVSAWIETSPLTGYAIPEACRTPRECVD